eukprot:6172162-Pleurochrysis_carterae.AAC.2
MNSGSSDSRPCVIYSQAHSSVYQRFHPVPLEALETKSMDTPGSSNPENRYYVWTVGREVQAFCAARAHTPHETVDVVPGRLFDSSPTLAAYFVQRPLSDCVYTCKRNPFFVVRLSLRELCLCSIHSSSSGGDYLSADVTSANVFASLEASEVMVVTPMPSRVRTASPILGKCKPGIAANVLRSEASPKSLLPRLWHLQVLLANRSIAVAILGG